MSARMTIKNDSLKIRIKEDIPKVCSDDWHVWTSLTNEACTSFTAMYLTYVGSSPRDR